MEEQLKAALAQAIDEFNDHRTAILQLAYDNGGQDGVTNVEQRFDALRDAYFGILQRQLDQNNPVYEQLITAANAETEKLRASVKQLNNINDMLNLMTEVIRLVGQIK